VSGPSNGALSGTEPILTYTPDADYNGPDSFTFKVNDGILDSNVATVSITIIPVNDPPVAFDQAVTTDEDIAVAITLSATDIEGDSLSYSFIDMPTLGSLSGLPPALTYTPYPNQYGSDSFTFRAHDGAAHSNPAIVSITINPVNDPPIVTLYSNPPADEGERIYFSGHYIDPDYQDTHTFTCDYGDGSTYSGPIVPSHVYGDNGVYTVTVTVTDNNGASGSDSKSVTVNNVAPVANAGPDQTVNEGDVISFAGSFADDGWLDTHTVEWDFGDGTTASGTLTPNHVFEENGIYTVTLDVTDDDGGGGTDNLIVLVNNVAPTVDIGSDQTVNEGDIVSFTGTFTDPGADDTHTMEWDFGDGTTDEGTLTPTHTYVDNGDYTVTLTVTDDDNGTYTNLVQLHYQDWEDTTGLNTWTKGWYEGGDFEWSIKNSPHLGNTKAAVRYSFPLGESYLYSPIFDFTKHGEAIMEWDQYWKADYHSGYQDGYVEISIDGGNTWVILEEFHHNDPKEETAHYQVSFPGAAGQSQVQFRFRIDMQYDWYWNVDNIEIYSLKTITIDGSGSATTTVTVNNVAPTPSIDSIVQPFPNFIMPTDTLEFTGSFSDPGIADTHTYEWDFGDGTIISGTLTPTHAYAAAGTFTVTLTVKDDDGDSGSVTTTVTVLSPQGAADDIITDVEDLNLPDGTENSFVSKLENAIKSLANDRPSAEGQLQAFINEVEAQRGKDLTNEQANALIAAAKWIIDNL
jgi:PKD repeat protein